MNARISKVCRDSGAALAGLAALALSACGLRVPPVQQRPLPSAPSPSTTPPATASATPSSATPTPTPSPTPTPTPTPTSTPTSTPTPPRHVYPPPSSFSGGFVVPGRPLRLRRRVLSPTIGRGSAPVHADAGRLRAVAERDALAALWLHAARMEHASVPAFADLALLLAAAGAPLDLVAAAHRAALDEVGHTEASYALANAYGATAHSPGALPRLLGRRTGSRSRVRTLRRLAVEALRDGCLNEGYNAALAAAGAAAATDPAVRESLARIAREEAAHTELSWQVLGWCLSLGDHRVTRAVARALRSLPADAPVPTPRDDLEAHGWPSPATAAAAYASVRAGVAERAAGLVALSAG